MTRSIVEVLKRGLRSLITQEQITEVVFTDPGIQRYVIWPNVHSVGYESGNNTRNKRINNRQNIIDAFACSLMRSAAKTGKKSKVFNIISTVFREFEGMNLNPCQVLITVIERLLVHEISFKTKIAGSNVSNSVEASCTKKLDSAVKILGLEIHRRSLRTNRSIVETISQTLLEIYRYTKGPLPSLLKKIDEQRQIAKAAR